MGVSGNLLQVNIVCEFHVLGVNTENFETAGGVGDANVDFTIETTETTKGRINRVRSVGGCHDHNIGASLKTVHEGEQLGDDTTLDFAVGLQNVSGNV